ncbi:epoxide hydrolase family protein [Patulibacter minatonensis]|uniref:epoxide hydrolase family protein n=1 Tax=Patulibacter minatonensis TaxID=298163 RepID=UPI00047EC605|nr:epoxide hydrolase family protein [Patulibacter minatonensis]
MATVAFRPFTVDVPEADLQDLRDRLARTRWPEAAPAAGWDQGVPLAYVQEVCEHWRTSYDWRVVEGRLNALDQQIATVDGLDVHVLHVRSPEPTARPLLLTHGWPGSVLEFLDVLGPLTDPVAHGGDAADAFHVVAPSLPGYGFSARPDETGWGLERIASAWVELMHALGYERFFAGGGDWGSLLTHTLGIHHAEHLDGVHLTLGVCSPEALMALGDPTEDEQRQIGKLQAYVADENGYAQQQATRPQTLGYGLTDSPAGQAAWILEKFGAWTDSGHDPESVIARDALLDNVSLYWLTATATSSARLYWQSFGGVLASFESLACPVGYSVFPEDLFEFSERWARTRYPDLRYYARPARGGHFASLEQPELFVDEVRAALRPMR